MFLGVFRSCMGKEVDSEVRLLLLLLWALGLRYSSDLAYFECTRPPRHGSNVDALVASIVPIWIFAMRRELRFGLPVWVYACLLSAPAYALLMKACPRAPAILFVCAISTTCV